MTDTLRKIQQDMQTLETRLAILQEKCKHLDSSQVTHEAWGTCWKTTICQDCGKEWVYDD